MFLKVLCVSLLCGWALAAPSELNLKQAAKKRVERNRRGLFPGSADERQLDLQNYAPLDIVEHSLEVNDGEGDNEVNGTKLIDDKDIRYYHKKNQGTVKTIVEEKNRDGNKLENVFYHLSYEKTQEKESTPAVYDTTIDTTDQTLDDYTTLAEDDETTPAAVQDEESVKPIRLSNILDLIKSDNEPLTDATVLSVENVDPDSPASDQSDPAQDPSASAGWFNNWFDWLGQTPVTDDSASVSTTEPAAALPDTPELDRAIDAPQFTLISPFCFGSIGLKSPVCPPHRPTLVTLYVFSFCV